MVGKGGVKLGLRRQARGIEFALPVDGGYLLLDLFITQVVEEVYKGIPELKRVQRLASPLCEVVGDKLVEVVSANEAIQVVKEVEALLISNSAVDILRVHVVVANDELGVLVVLAKVCNSIL